jgi:hypothetical protein
MSSEKLGHSNNVLKGDLGGGFNAFTGSSGEQTELGIARRFGGSAGAYSLRDIGAMNGRVIEVRRSSDNSPADFTALQIASGAVEDFVGSGNDGFVATWYDQSGNGNDFAQGTTSEQPKIVSSGSLITGANGLPAISFADDAVTLERAEFLNGQLSAYFFTFDSEAGDSSEAQVLFRQGSSYRLISAVQTDGNIRGQIRDGGGDSVILDAGGDLATGGTLLQSIFIRARGANGIYNYVDGANEKIGNTTDIEDTDFAAADSGDIAIGGIAGGTFDFKGKIQEMIFFESDLFTDKSTIETELNNYYNAF